MLTKSLNTPVHGAPVIVTGQNQQSVKFSKALGKDDLSAALN